VADIAASPVTSMSGQQTIAIAVRDLHVRFKVFSDRQLTSVELMRRGFRSRESSFVHAVRGVSFDVNVGEAVGLIGSNGSGKSTTLRAIAGLEQPTEGQVLVRFQPHLLGVQTALQPQLSGRRNIVLGCLAMGLTMDEITERMDDVIRFSGLQNAIQRPLKTYSSGMRARLSFSIATLRTPEILLVDEALAVGDRKFRRRSLARIREIQQNAGTIVMVTHNLGEIRKTCSRVIWLDEGRIVTDGPVDEVLEQYEAADPD
jgi:teichoic acid transport system ATP-binding protein